MLMGEKATSKREQRKFTCFAEQKWFHVINPLTFEKHFAQVSRLFLLPSSKHFYLGLQYQKNVRL